MPTLLKHTVFNELSNARNTNNMAMLQVMFSYDKELAPASLAGVFFDLLLQKECYLRALRALLREIVRFLRYDINLHVFCFHLMQLPVSSLQFTKLRLLKKTRVFLGQKRSNCLGVRVQRTSLHIHHGSCGFGYLPWNLSHRQGSHDSLSQRG